MRLVGKTDDDAVVILFSQTRILQQGFHTAILKPDFKDELLFCCLIMGNYGFLLKCHREHVIFFAEFWQPALSLTTSGEVSSILLVISG